jgi:hypothetical protein
MGRPTGLTDKTEEPAKMRNWVITALFLLLCVTELFGQQAAIEERFETIFKTFEEYYGEYGGSISTPWLILDWSPYTPKLIELGPEIVPLLVEKMRTSKAHILFRQSLAFMVTGLIYHASDPCWRSEQVDAVLFDKCWQEPGISVDKWLKWWEEEGKKLYEKRMKELKEKEKTEEKPKPKEEPQEKPQPGEPKEQPKPEKTEPKQKPPTEPSHPQGAVQKTPSEKEPVGISREVEPQPGSGTWLVLALIVTAIVLAGLVLFLLLRLKRANRQ